MKKTFAVIAVAIMTVVCAQAQKIQTIDSEGHAIPLVSVFTEGGVLIGTTDINGTLADVKGAGKISLTHIAYKPQLVSVSSLTEGRVTMESIDYGLDEIVVKPKPFIYMEYYFRGFSYIGDSLRCYGAGIIPVAHEVQNGYHGKTRNIWSYGGAANKALAWNVSDLALKAEKGAKSALIPIETLIQKGKNFKNYYKVSMEPDGDNRWVVKNPEGKVGLFQHKDGHYSAMLDAGKMQIYAGKAEGKEKLQKAREDRNYDYQYSEVYTLDEEGNIQPYNMEMQMSHWEYDSSKGRNIIIIYLYATEHSYMDADEFKARSKELNKGYSGDMPLEELEKYEREHNIPALVPSQQLAIQQLEKKTGK